MADKVVLKIEDFLNPITALAFLGLGTSDRYLLAGEGQYLKVFDYQRGRLIHVEQVFNSQAIHGIACEAVSRDNGQIGLLLIWGGRCICLASIRVKFDQSGELVVVLHQHMPGVLSDDWILDGCFRPAEITGSIREKINFEGMLVTAHNEVLCIRFVMTDRSEVKNTRCLFRIASGISSVLYSAHMLCADSGRRLLIAAGTVFGEVLLWSFPFDESDTPEVSLHYTFTGHEGSIFGVRISEETNKHHVRRILASCSDDRTIRIWNISDTRSSESLERTSGGGFDQSEAGFLEEHNERDSTGCLAASMGHNSRIWGLRFLFQKDGVWDLISFGEDSTAQRWRLSSVLGTEETNSTPLDHAHLLSHQATYAYHSGKNLWAMAVLPDTHEGCKIATGGADGRITVCRPLLEELPGRTDTWMRQYTMDEILKALETTSSVPSPKKVDREVSCTERIFESLKGSWKLLRNLDSLVPTYPSGTLRGIAIFAGRRPTDDKYDAEYLYSESGDFNTQQGLMMRATRNYAYRYSRTTDSISVWFVKSDERSTVDYLFHNLDFRDTNPCVDLDAGIWHANGYHLCIEDNYNAKYSFELKNSEITQWQAGFDVDGPKKDYVAKAKYTRHQSEPEVAAEKPAPVNLHLKKTEEQPLGNKTLQTKPDSFKAYVWISEREVLTITEQGHVVVGTLDSNVNVVSQFDCTNVTWEHVGHRTGLSSSSIATGISSSGVALLTGTDGTVYLYRRCSEELNAIGRLPGKAGYLKAHILTEPWGKWLRFDPQRELVGVFGTCLGSSQASVFMFSSEKNAKEHLGPNGTYLSEFYECSLTLLPKFIVMSSCFLETEICIMLGSRNGEIAIYDLVDKTPNSALDASPTHIQNIHGEDAITLIQSLPREVSYLIGRTAIISAGRDGRWKLHHLYLASKKGSLFVKLETIHVGVPPFGPNIEGACIDSMSRDLLLWGFRSRQFVVWNESQKTEVMTVDCGGPHRDWTYAHRYDGSGGGCFTYTKASICHLHSQMRASHQVIQYGGHGREIKALALSPVIKTSYGANLRFVATGAEDTAIRVFALDAGFKCMSVVTKHTTGIQQLRWSSDGQLLFSAAGCEEFFAWRLQPAPLVMIGIICEAQCPTVTEEVDLRIMDFVMEEIHTDHDPDDVGYEPDYLLSKVYSDSSVRIFRYHTSAEKKSFKLLTLGSYTTYCLTQAVHLHDGEMLNALCTTSTDGHVAFWSLPTHLLYSDHDIPQGNLHLPAQINPPMHWTTRSAIHQSSVKALDCVATSESEKLLVTGGDDGAIALTRVVLHQPPNTDYDTSTLLIPSAHASAVTGVVLTRENHKHGQNHRSKIYGLATVGNDQRLKIWTVSIDMTKAGVAGVDVRSASTTYTSVADASSIATYRDADGQRWLLVAGIGMERWRIGSGRAVS